MGGWRGENAEAALRDTRGQRRFSPSVRCEATVNEHLSYGSTDVKRRSATRSVVVILLAGAVIGVGVRELLPWLFSSAIYDSTTPHLPSDASIRNTFQAHQSAINELREMISSEPGLREVGRDCLAGCSQHDPRPTTFTRQRDGSWIMVDSAGNLAAGSSPAGYRTADVLRRIGLSPDRFAKYCDMIQTLGAQRLDRTASPSNEQVIELFLGLRGFVASGESKSVVSFPKGLPSGSIVVDDTDGPSARTKGQWYTPLADGWFIKIDRW